MGTFNKNYKVGKNSIIQYLVNLLIIITIGYNSGSAISTANNRIGFALMIVSICAIFLMYAKIKTSFKVNYFNLYFALMVIMVINSLVVNGNFRFIENNIRYLVILLFSFMFVKYVKLETFVYYYTKIMTFLVIISLIPFYLVNTFQVDLVKYMPIFENINGVQYYNGIFFHFYTYSTRRNMGIFWEPSIYSSFIIMAMLFEISYKKPSKSRLIILLLGLLSTGSTGGFFLIPFIAMVLLFRKSNTLKSIVIQTGLLFSSLWSFVNMERIFAFLAEKNPLVFGKLVRENSASLFDRVNSPTANIELFLDNPIFGQGLGKVDELYSGYLISQTSTSTYYLAAFGIFGIIYTATIIYGAYRRKQLNLTTRILIAIILILIVNKEPHARLVLTHIFIFYLIKPRESREVLTKH